MGKLYKGQTLLRWNFTAINASSNTALDLTGYDYLYLKVKFPGNSTSTWTCTVSDASTGTFYFDAFTAGSFKTAGTYSIQPEISISGETGPCETFKIRVYGDYE
jgi:hypothetical protein